MAANQLSRTIENITDGIRLCTQTIGGFEYAFYLRHPKGVEQQFYSEKNYHVFDIKPVAGYYTAVFFYKENNSGTKSVIQVPFIIGEFGTISILNKREIASEEGYKIDYYDIGSETTFIVFNGTRSTLSTAPFGLNFLLGKGYNVIACLQNNDQYQSLSFEDFQYYVSPLVAGKRTFLYGSSLGGYCAVYYAGAVNGNVIASAPRNSGHPALIDFWNGLYNYKVENFKHKEIIENCLSTGNIYIFIDPYVDADVFFLEKCITNAYANVQLLEFKYAGHEVLMHVNRTGQLRKIISNIVTSDELDIDYSVDSEYTEIGKANFHLARKDKRQAAVFVSRVLKREISNKRVLDDIKKIRRELRMLS